MPSPPNTMLHARAFRTSPRPAISQRWFLICAIVVIVYALLDEYHQSFVPSRTASIFDSFIDMAGGLTALLWTALKMPIRHSTERSSAGSNSTSTSGDQR